MLPYMYTYIYFLLVVVVVVDEFMVCSRAADEGSINLAIACTRHSANKCYVQGRPNRVKIVTQVQWTQPPHVPSTPQSLHPFLVFNIEIIYSRERTLDNSTEPSPLVLKTKKAKEKKIKKEWKKQSLSLYTYNKMRLKSIDRYCWYVDTPWRDKGEKKKLMYILYKLRNRYIKKIADR